MMSAPKHPFQQPSTQIIEVSGEDVHQFPPDAAGPLAIVLTATNVSGGQRITFREQTTTSRANATLIAADNPLEGEAMIPSAFGQVSPGNLVTIAYLPGRDEMLAYPHRGQVFVFPDFVYGRVSQGLYLGSYSTVPRIPGGACYVSTIQNNNYAFSPTWRGSGMYVGYPIGEYNGLPLFWVDKKIERGVWASGFGSPLPAATWTPILGPSPFGANYILTDDTAELDFSGLITGSGGVVWSVVGPRSTWPSGATRTYITSFSEGNLAFSFIASGTGNGELTFFDLEFYPSSNANLISCRLFIATI